MCVPHSRFHLTQRKYNRTIYRQYSCTSGPTDYCLRDAGCERSNLFHLTERSSNELAIFKKKKKKGKSARSTLFSNLMTLLYHVPQNWHGKALLKCHFEEKTQCCVRHPLTSKLNHCSETPAFQHRPKLSVTRAEPPQPRVLSKVQTTGVLYVKMDDVSLFPPIAPK